MMNFDEKTLSDVSKVIFRPYIIIPASVIPPPVGGGCFSDFGLTPLELKSDIFIVIKIDTHSLHILGQAIHSYSNILISIPAHLQRP